MATMTHAESRRLYSWWWDSHISPKNSKWLQENLTDMDVKVKSMIKLIEEDADSFARRAEMYFKKRPELMKLVEEFYRAYRALAERYDHATGALHQAHRTMAEVFPNQVPFSLTDDSPSGSSTPEGEPRTPEIPPPLRAFVEPDDLRMGALGQSSHFHAIKRNGAYYSEENDSLNSKRGLKQVNEMLSSGEATSQSKSAEGKVRKGLNFHEEEGKIHESKLHSGSADIQKNEKGEKHDAYEKTKVLQGEVSQLSSEDQNLKMQMKSEHNHVGKCENEIQRLQESLSKSEAGKDIALLECQKLLEKISSLKVEISCIHEDNRKLNNEMLIKLARLESAEERCLLLETEKQALEMEVQDLAQQANGQQQELQQKQDEIDKLKHSLQEEHNRYTQAEAALQSLEKLHTQSLEKLSITASELQNGVEKLKHMELRNCHLEEDIQQVKEANSNLNKELKLMEEELKKLNISMHDEHLLSVKTEEALRSMEKLHSQSQEEIRILTLDVFNKVDMLKDMELKKQQLEEDVQQLNEKNENLNEQILSSALMIKNLQEQILSLKEALDKLENEVEHHLHENKALQQELHCVREELTDLDLKHQCVLEQIEAVGLNKDSFQVSVRELQDGNLELKELYSKHVDENVILINKLENNEKVSEKNILLEISLSDATVELEGLREKVTTLEKCCESLNRSISHLTSEKSSLVCQLESVAHNTEKLSENNTFLENSLSDANVELEGLREKLKSLEESYQSLCNENSNLRSEKILLISQMESLGTTLENMNKSYAELEDKHLFLEREKESTLILISELQNQLKLEQQEHEAFVLSSNTQLATLKDHISVFKEESRSKDKELEGLLHKLLNWEMQTFILQKCLLDSQEWNQKNLASARHTEKLLSEQIRLLQQEHQSLVLSSNSQLATLSGQISLVQQESQTKDKELKALQHKVLNSKLQFIELQNLLKLEQHEHEAFVLSSNTQLGTLEDRVSLLEEESQSKDKELERLQHKLSNWEMWAFILQSCLLDSKEYCWKRLASARHTEKLLSDKISLLQQEHHAFVLLSNSQFATLAGQISLIRQEDQSKDKELKGFHHKLLNCELQAFILQKCLLDSKLWSQKHLAFSRHVEKLLIDMKQENIGQKKMIEYVSENYKKLQEGIQMVLTLSGVENTCESEGTPDESHYQHILDKIKEMQNFISDTIDENHFLLLEKSVIITLLQQLGLDLSILQLENNALDQEYKIGTQQLLSLNSEKLELLQINEKLRQVIHAGNLREDKLKTETDILGKQLLDLHESHKESQAAICAFLEENRSLTNEVSGLRDEMQKLEEENCVIFAEAINISCLSLIFEQFSSERAMNLKICSTDLDSLYRANNVLENKLAEMIQKIELIEAENILLKSSAIKLEDCQCHLLMLQDDLNTASSVHEQLNHQIEQLSHQNETGKNLLIQRALDLTEANKKVEETENEKINLYKDLDVIKMEFDEIIGVRKELEKKICMLIDDNSQKDNKIAHIHGENQMLNAVIQNLRNGLVELRTSKEHLASELTYEIKLYEEEVARLWSDNHISTVHVEIFEEKMLELIGECESLEISAIIQKKILKEQIISSYTYTDQLNQRLDSSERQSRTLKEQLNAYVSLVLSLQNSIASLENQTLSLMEHHEMNCHSAKDASVFGHKHVKSFEQLSMDIVELDGVLELQMLQARIEELQKVLMDYCSILTWESGVDAKSAAAEMEIVVSKPERTLDEEETQLKENMITPLEAEVHDPGKNVVLQSGGAKGSKGGYGSMVKDIQLDQSSFDAGTGLYKKVGVEDAETDEQMLKLWETAESDYNNEMLRPSSITTADDIVCHQIEAVEEQKSKYPSESVAEKELGVDKLGMPKKADPYQQWNKGILECLASDAQRLSILQNSLQELKMQLEKSEKSDTSTNMKYDTMKGQLERAEETISELVDINTNLTKKAEDCSTFYDGEAGEPGGFRNQQKGKVSDEPQRGLEKIGKLELELQNIQYMLLKLNEQHENRLRASQGRSRVILRDYLYGRREGYRQKSGHFCGCIRPKTSGD